MRLIQWDKSKSVEGQDGAMLRVSKKEAYALIHSLLYQISADDPNYHRAEHDCLVGDTFEKIYFSISVVE